MRQFSFFFSATFLMSFVLSLHTYAQGGETTVNTFTNNGDYHYTTVTLSRQLEISDINYAEGYHIVYYGAQLSTTVTNFTSTDYPSGPISREMTFTLLGGGANLKANVQVLFGPNSQVSVRVDWSTAP